MIALEARKKCEVFVGKEEDGAEKRRPLAIVDANGYVSGKYVRNVSLGADQAFDTSMCLRNLALIDSGFPAPRTLKTGTTIVGCDGVVIGGDKRSTMGNIVMDKRAHKVESLAKNIWVGGAGTAADLYKVRNMIEANLRLHELNTGKPARVAMAIGLLREHLFKYQGHIGTHLVVGGVDLTGVHLFGVSANAHSQRYMFTSQGSGSYIATSVLENGFRQDMTEEECVSLVRQALQQAMMGDNASGNALDMVVVNKNGPRFIGPIFPDFVRRMDPKREYAPKRGTTIVLKEKTYRYNVVEETIEQREKDVDIVAQEVAAMEVQ